MAFGKVYVRWLRPSGIIIGTVHIQVMRFFLAGQMGGRGSFGHFVSYVIFLCKLIRKLQFIQNKIVWGPQFQRALEDWMVDSWVSLLNLLGRLFVVGTGKDKRLWELDTHCLFIVKSFCMKLMSTGEDFAIHHKVWKGSLRLR